MNIINPKKLLHTQWTAVIVHNKEKHFIVTKLIKNNEGVVVECDIEAALTQRIQRINWRDLQNTEYWISGWK